MFMQLVNATSTELSSVCRTHAHFLLFLCNLLRDGKQVQRCIEACANTNNRNSFYTGGRSELFFGCFCLQLCSLSGWPHSVCVLGEAHPWRTDFLSVFLSLCFYCTGSVTRGRCVSDVCRPHTLSFVLYSLRTHCAEICNVFSSFWINLLVQKFHFMSNCGTFHGFYFTKFTPLKLQYQNLKCAQRRITGCTKSSMFEFPSASIRSSSHSRAEVGDPAAIFLQKYQDIFKSCLLVCVWVNVSACSFVGHGADE